MKFLILIISGWLYRLDGKDDGINYARHFIGIPIAVILWDWRYIVSYALAGFFVYGDKSIFSKLFGRKIARLIHGFAFGLASFNPMFSIWTTVVFYVLFEMAERNMIENSWSERLRGGLGTIIYLWP